MKTDVSVTSILAYKLVDLKGQKYKIVKAMRDLIPTKTPLTRENIQIQAGILKDGSMCARMKELENDGIISPDSFTIGNYGVNVQTYKLVTKGQTSLI